MIPCIPSRFSITRRGWLKLLAAGLGGTALPAFGQEAAAPPPDEPKLPGRIFAFAGAWAPDELEGVIAIDPENGAWRSVSSIRDAGPNARVSPDSRSLAYVKFIREDDETEIWIADLEGEQEPRRLAVHAGFPLWSPEGRQLLVAEPKGGDPAEPAYQTWRIDVEGQGRTRLPIPETDRAWDWSPDGQWLVTSSGRDLTEGEARRLPWYRWPLYIMRLDGTEARPLFKGGEQGQRLPYSVRFSADSRHVLIAHLHRTPEGQLSILGSVGLDSSPLREIVRGTAEAEPTQARPSPDGAWLAISYSRYKAVQGRERINLGHEDFLEIRRPDGTLLHTFETLRDYPHRGIFVLDWR